MDFAFVGDPLNLVAIAVVAVLVVTLGLRLRSNRLGERRESRLPRDCISAKMAWDGNNPIDDRIKNILAERNKRRGS